MRIRLVFLGKTRNPHLQALIDDYRKRIARFTSIEIIEWKTTDGGPWAVAEARGKDASSPVVLGQQRAAPIGVPVGRRRGLCGRNQEGG
jgi:23S rRNA pseudoU1915 N3-methylase RlmH